MPRCVALSRSRRVRLEPDHRWATVRPVSCEPAPARPRIAVVVAHGLDHLVVAEPSIRQRVDDRLLWHNRSSIVIWSCRTSGVTRCRRSVVRIRSLCGMFWYPGTDSLMPTVSMTSASLLPAPDRMTVVTGRNLVDRRLRWSMNTRRTSLEASAITTWPAVSRISTGYQATAIIRGILYGRIPLRRLPAAHRVRSLRRLPFAEQVVLGVGRLEDDGAGRWSGHGRIGAAASTRWSPDTTKVRIGASFARAPAVSDDRRYCERGDARESGSSGLSVDMGRQRCGPVSRRCYPRTDAHGSAVAQHSTVRERHAGQEAPRIAVAQRADDRRDLVALLDRVNLHPPRMRILGLPSSMAQCFVDWPSGTSTSMYT